MDFEQPSKDIYSQLCDYFIPLSFEEYQRVLLFYYLVPALIVLVFAAHKLTKVNKKEAFCSYQSNTLIIISGIYLFDTFRSST